MLVLFPSDSAVHTSLFDSLRTLQLDISSEEIPLSTIHVEQYNWADVLKYRWMRGARRWQENLLFLRQQGMASVPQIKPEILEQLSFCTLVHNSETGRMCWFLGFWHDKEQEGFWHCSLCHCLCPCSVSGSLNRCFQLPSLVQHKAL